MIRLKSIAGIMVLAVAGLLSSCIDSREEYWLQADGSGVAEITYHLPAAAAAVHGGESGVREMIADFLMCTPEFRSSSHEVVTEGKRLRVKIHVAFDSALALKDITAGNSLKRLPSEASHLVGDVTADLRGLTLDFTRKISASKALPGSIFLPASQINGHRMTYIMHLPAAPSESNATRVEDGGRTLIWDIPLARALKSPVITRFKIAVPIPWRRVSAIAIPLSMSACAWILLRRRKSRGCFPVGNPRDSVL